MLCSVPTITVAHLSRDLQPLRPSPAPLPEGSQDNPLPCGWVAAMEPGVRWGVALQLAHSRAAEEPVGAAPGAGGSALLGLN